MPWDNCGSVICGVGNLPGIHWGSRKLVYQSEVSQVPPLLEDKKTQLPFLHNPCYPGTPGPPAAASGELGSTARPATPITSLTNFNTHL